VKSVEKFEGCWRGRGAAEVGCCAADCVFEDGWDHHEEQ
jgi:hypothetical protein